MKEKQKGKEIILSVTEVHDAQHYTIISLEGMPFCPMSDT